MDNYQKLNEEIKKIPAAVNCSENPLLLSISGDNSDIRQIEETNHIINDDHNSDDRQKRHRKCAKKYNRTISYILFFNIHLIIEIR